MNTDVNLKYDTIYDLLFKPNQSCISAMYKNLIISYGLIIF